MARSTVHDGRLAIHASGRRMPRLGSTPCRRGAAGSGSLRPAMRDRSCQRRGDLLPGPVGSVTSGTFEPSNVHGYPPRWLKRWL